MGTLSLSRAATICGLHLSEAGLLLFGLIVVVGLIGEIKLPSWHLRLKLFELLVIIGVAGELICDGGVFVFSEHLQTISDIEVAHLNIEAANARKEAAEALEHAAQLTAALAPRSLSDKAAREIADECRPLAKAGIKVVVIVGSGNARTLGIQVFDIMKRAGFDTELRPTNNVWYEVSISGPTAPLDHLGAWTGITKAFAKRMPIFGGRPLSPSSPITIAIGERLIGKLP
jgi:hypothetical protein